MSEIQRGELLLRATDVVKHYPVRSGFRLRGEREVVHAVDGVSLDVHRGETLGVVGESGCGKSTLGRCLVRLTDLTSGTVEYAGQDITRLSRRQLRPVRRDVQLVFQDPYASLNPRRRVGDVVAEPLQVHNYGTKADGRRRGAKPVSALDVSIQAQVLNLFADLQDDLGLTYVFIAHDLGVVRHVSDRIAVMYLGEVVEIADADPLYDAPAHPYTEALLSAAPEIDDGTEELPRERIVLTGDVPNPVDKPTGCPFHPRCPYAQDRCRTERPPLMLVAPGRYTACHFPLVTASGAPAAESVAAS